MRTHAQAVVIGGGVIGCSILYHLTKLGWTDVCLLERDELTSGSTWHAAANIHGLHDNNNITRIQNYTMDLYNSLEAETGQSCGVFQPGSLYLAQTEAREHQLRLQEAKARFYGLNFHEISRERAKELHPLAQFDDIRCIMYEPDGGNVDPSGVTMAYAAGARAMGAEIQRFCPVIGTDQQPDGSWIVRTEKGDIHTQWVVNANMEEDVVYDVTRALWHPNNRKLLDNGHIKGKLIRPETALDGVSTPLHAGAEKYYRENGMIEN